MSDEIQEMSITTMPFAIYEVKEAEIKTPMGPRNVRILTKIGEHMQNVPEEIAPQLKEVKEFNRDILVEGRGQVIAETSQGIMPHPIAFLFDEGITTFTEAFARFDEHMEKEIMRRQQAAQQQKQKIQLAGADQLNAINADASRGMKIAR